jgi:hypothetical protein
VTTWDEPLNALKWHWGSAYVIAHPAADAWIAQRRDDHATLRAEDPAELRDKILGDYFANPVPRSVAP